MFRHLPRFRPNFRLKHKISLPKKKISLGSLASENIKDYPENISVLFFYVFGVVFTFALTVLYANGYLDPYLLGISFLSGATYANFEFVIIKQVYLFGHKITLARADIYCLIFLVLAINFIEFIRFGSIYVLRAEPIRKFCLSLVKPTVLAAIVCFFVAFSTLYSSYASIRNSAITEASKLESEINSGENFIFNKNLNSAEIDRLFRFRSVEDSLINATGDTALALSIPNNSRAISLVANDFPLKKVLVVVFSVNDIEISHKIGISFIESKPVNSFAVVVPHDKVGKFKNLSSQVKSTLLLRAENAELFCKEFSGFSCQTSHFSSTTSLFSWKSSSVEDIPYHPESLLDELKSKFIGSKLEDSAISSAISSQAQFKDLMTFVGLASSVIIVNLARLLAYVFPSYLKFLRSRSVTATPKSLYLFLKRRYFLIKLASKTKTVYYVNKVDLDFTLAALTVIICFVLTILTIVFFKL